MTTFRRRHGTPWFSDQMLNREQCTPELHDCGSGYRLVDRQYVDHYWPRVTPPIDEPMTEREARLNTEVMEGREQEREDHARDVYPCPVHNPELWQKFIDGDWPYERRHRPAAQPPPSPGSAAAKMLGLDEPEQFALEMPYRADTDA